MVERPEEDFIHDRLVAHADAAREGSGAHVCRTVHAYRRAAPGAGPPAVIRGDGLMTRSEWGLAGLRGG